MSGVFFGVYGFFRAAPALHTPKKLECSPGHSNNFGAAPPECSLRSVVSNCLNSIAIQKRKKKLFGNFLRLETPHNM